MSFKNTDKKVSKNGKEKANRKRRHSSGPDDGDLCTESGVDDADEANDVLKVKKQLKDLTDCWVCLGTYKEPKILPCVHTFCMKCLEETGSKSNKNTGDQMSCPVCRKEFTIPEEGFIGLQKNSFIEKLLEMRKNFPSSSTPGVCDACLEDGDQPVPTNIPSAEMYCLDCRQKLCEDCGKHHRKNKVTKTHKVLPLNDCGTEREIFMASLGPSFCDQHTQESLTMYCLDCKKVVCALCFIENHKQHNGNEATKLVDVFSKQIRKNVADSEDLETELAEKLTSLEKGKCECLSKIDDTKTEINGARNELQALVDKDADLLLEELEISSRECVKEVEFAREKIGKHVAGLSTYKAYCHEMVNRGSASDICQGANDLSKRVAEFEEIHDSVQSHLRLKPCEISFKKTKLYDFTNTTTGNIVGKISPSGNNVTAATEEPRLTENDNSCTDDPMAKLRAENSSLKDKTKCMETKLEKIEKMLKHIRDQSKIKAKIAYRTHMPAAVTIGITDRARGRNAKVSGIALLDDELFVTIYFTPHLQVYDTRDYSSKRILRLKDVVWAIDMTSCKTNKCLYISNAYHARRNVLDPNTNKLVAEYTYENEIVRVDANGNLIKKWWTGVPFAGSAVFDKKRCRQSLSITNDANVLATKSYEKKFFEYSPDGLLIKETDLGLPGLNISCPWHVIKLTGGHFLVSHGDGSSDPLHRVVLVENGVVKSSFGGSSGSDYDQLNNPLRMAVDSDGSVMVLEFSGRVSLLRRDLQCKKKLLSTRDELMSPSRMILDELGGRLFVAHLMPSITAASTSLLQSSLQQSQNLKYESVISVFTL